MSEKQQILYKMYTILGEYWVIASNSSEAEQKLKKYLDDADYGFTDKRKVTRIDIIAISASDIKWVTGKNLLL